MADTPDSDEELIAEATRCHRNGRDRTSTWRMNARQWYAFRAGDQWDEQDIKSMQDLNRPHLTFNRCEAIIEAICGQEANSRHETKFQPRSTEDGALSEAANTVAKWMLEECDAPHEEAEAFSDMLTCGYGWTDDRMDYETDETGLFMRERVDPIEMYWDPAAKKKNLSDRRWDLRITDIDTEALREAFPDAEIQPKDMFPVDQENQVEIHDQDASNMYEGGATTVKYGQTRVGIYQWYELEDFHLVQFNGKTETLDSAGFSKFQANADKVGAPYQSTKIRKKVYYRALMAGGVVLSRKPSPVDGFTTKVMTGRRDRNKGTCYGVMKAIVDPQKWSNKFFSSMIDIIASNAKGGVMVEQGAVADMRAIETSWANPRRTTQVNTGALSNGRIKEKPTADYPQSMDKLLAFAVTSIRDVSGVNVEMLGMADRDQPGVVEAQRKQSALAILAPLFDSLKSYRKEAGRSQLQFMQRFIPTQTIARLIGPALGQRDPEKLQQIVAMLKDESAMKFDIIVEEGAMSANQKEQSWPVLQVLLPEAMQLGLPIPPSVLDYTPLPKKLTEEWKAMIVSAQHAAQPIQQARTQLELQGMQGDNAKRFSQAEANKGRAAVAMKNAQAPDPTMLNFQLDMAGKQFDMKARMAEMQMEAKAMGLELQFKAAEHQMDMQHQQQQHQTDMVMGAMDHAQSMQHADEQNKAKIELMKQQPKGNA